MVKCNDVTINVNVSLTGNKPQTCMVTSAACCCCWDIDFIMKNEIVIIKYLFINHEIYI